MKQKITEIAKAEKISDIGFCSVAEYEKSAKLIFSKSKFSKENTKAEEIIKGAKTIIVCTFNYFNGKKRGNVSRYAQGEDYHKVVINKMNKIKDYLSSCGYIAETFSDTGFLNERLLAVESGIAFLGKNQMAISNKFGSYFFIGYIVTDCEIKPDKKSNKTCVGCNECVKACPLGALDNGFCEEKCLSYITQKKGELSEKEQNAMINVNTAWGCDVCQEVCPHNRNIPITDIAEFCDNIIENLKYEEISNKEFQKKYKNRAFSWRGKTVLMRNLKILEKN